MMIRSMPPASAHLARHAGAGPAADDRPAGGDLGAQALQTLFAGEKAHGGLLTRIG